MREEYDKEFLPDLTILNSCFMYKMSVKYK
jgi:hypothetical protein